MGMAGQNGPGHALSRTRLRAGVASTTATEDRVVKRYTLLSLSQLWGCVPEQLADDQIVDLSSKKGAGQPSTLTPTKTNRHVS